MECLPFLPASRSGKPSRQSSSITDSPFVPAPSMNPLFQLAVPSHTQGMSQDAWNPTTSDFSAQCVLEPASAGWDGEILTQVPFVTCLLDLSGSSLLYCPGLPPPPPSQASPAESAFLLQILGGDVDALTEVLASTGKGMTWQGSLAGQAQAGTQSSTAAVPELVTPASTVSQLQLARPLEAEHPVLLQGADQCSSSLHKTSHPGPLAKDSMQQTRAEGAINGYKTLLAESATEAFMLTLSPSLSEHQPIQRGCSNLSTTPLADTCPVDMQAHEEGLGDAMEDTGTEAYNKARHSPVRRCITSVNVVKRRLPSRMRNQSKTAVMLERMLHAKSVTDQVSCAGLAPSIGASSGPSSLIEDSLAFQLPGLPEAMMDSEPGQTTQRWGLPDAGGGMVSPARSFSQRLPQVSPACQLESGDEAQRPVLQHTPSGLQPTALLPLSSSFTSSRGGHRVRRHSSLCLINEEQHQQLQQQQQPLFPPLDLGRRSVTCLEEPELRQRLELVADAASGTMATGSEVLPAGVVPPRTLVSTSGSIRRRLPDRMRNQSKTAAMLERILQAQGSDVGNTTSSGKRTVPAPDLPTRASDEPEIFRTLGNPVPLATPPVVPMPVPVSVTPCNDGLAWDSISGRASHQLGSSPPQLAVRFAPTVPAAPTVSEPTSASRLEPLTSPLLFQLLDIAEERQTAQQAANDHSQVSTREDQHQPDISLPSLLPDPNPPHTTPTAEVGSPKALQRLAQRVGRSIGKRLRAAVTQLSLKVERSVDSLSNPWASASHLHAMPPSRQHTNSPDARSASSGAESPSLRSQRGVLRGASVPLLPTSPSRSASNLHMMLSSAPHPGTPPSLPGTHTVPSLSESALTGHPTLVRTMSNSCPQAAVLAVQASQMKLPNHQPSACAPSTSDSLQQRLSAPAASGSQPSAAQLASQTMLLPASHVLVQQAKVRSVSVTVRPILHRRTGQRALLVVQQDTSEAQEMEALLADLAESQLNMASNLFPRHIVEFLATSGQNISPQQMSTLARQHHDVTLLFMDIVGFTTMSKQVPPEAVMVFLNTFFGQLDELCDRCGVTKIETAGDCYIVAGGIARSGGNRNPDQIETVTEDGQEGFTSILESHDPADSATRVMEFAKAMMACSKTVLTPHNNEPVVIRIGLHTGNCVSGLIGTKLPKFAIFGDTMNTASRMESTCTPGRIQVSEPTAKLLSHEQWEPTGGIEVKGKGLMWTFLWAGQCPDHQPDPVSSASRPDSTAPAESHLQQIQELRWSEEQEQDAVPEMMRTMDGMYIRPSQDINLSELKNASTPGSSSHPCRPTCLSPFTAAMSHANSPGAGERTATSNSGATTQAHMTQRAARALELLQQSRQSNVSAEDKEGTKQRSLSSKHRLALRGLAQATKPAQGWTSKPRPRQVEKDAFVMAEGVEYMMDKQPDAHGLPLSSHVSTADEMLNSLLSKSCGSVQATSSATITSVADFQAALLPTAPTPQTDSATRARGAESCGASPGEGASGADRKQPLGMHTALAAAVGNERVAWRPAPPAQTTPGSAAPGPGDGQPPDKQAEPEAAEQPATSLGGTLAAAGETGALGSQACIHPAPPRASRAYIRFSLDHGNVCPPGPAAGQGSGVPPAATDNLLNSRSSISRLTARPDGADSPGGGKLPLHQAATPGSALPQLSASMRLVKLAQHQLLGQLAGQRHHQGRRRSAVLLQPPEDLQSVLEEGRGVGAPEPTSFTARVKRRPMKSSRSFCVPSTQGTMPGLPAPWAQALSRRADQEADAEASEDGHPTMAAAAGLHSTAMPPPAQPVSRLMCDSSQTLPCRTSRTSTTQPPSHPAEPVGRQQSLASDGGPLGTRSANPRPASLLREVVEGQWLALAASPAPACPYPAAGWPPAPSAASGMLSSPGPSSAAPSGQQAGEVPGARPGAAAPSSPQRVKSSSQSPGLVQADSGGQQVELLEPDALSLLRPKRRPLSSSRSMLDIAACLPRHPPNDPSAQTLVLALPMDGHLDTVEEDALNAITSQSNIQQAAASNDWPVGYMDIAPSAAQAANHAPADRPSCSWQVLAASSAGPLAAPAAAAASPGDRAATPSPHPSGVTAAVSLVSRPPGTGPPDPTPAQAPASTASPSTRLVQLAHSTQHGVGAPRADSSGQQGVLLEPGALNSHKPSRRPLRSSRSFYINNAE